MAALAFHLSHGVFSAQQTLGLKRQIFFVRVGGFDLHDNQVTAGATLPTTHPSSYPSLLLKKRMARAETQNLERGSS